MKYLIYYRQKYIIEKSTYIPKIYTSANEYFLVINKVKSCHCIFFFEIFTNEAKRKYALRFYRTLDKIFNEARVISRD